MDRGPDPHPDHDAAQLTAADPLTVHNAAVDEGAARGGGCAQVHLPTGATCILPRGHEGSCAFSEGG
ncbi:hypothetical protein [Nocardioides marmoribigeumensis]|jgi:hypothetical protein|uniref:Uncharacterized protein n=1 Tax=Nocardioides marmoribigeumensis TaxID=433649 RepID=A0ABU2BXT4_9ACTN|nr:hypothetical protein [Nocardioides marmoribigeumensis]MDR7363210.1 hypothetical protein [Nocardioides marmoribigeumensis]